MYFQKSFFFSFVNSQQLGVGVWVHLCISFVLFRLFEFFLFPSKIVCIKLLPLSNSCKTWEKKIAFDEGTRCQKYVQPRWKRISAKVEWKSKTSKGRKYEIDTKMSEYLSHLTAQLRNSFFFFFFLSRLHIYIYMLLQKVSKRHELVTSTILNIKWDYKALLSYIYNNI